MDIEQALQTLDKDADDHWTSDGMPRVDAVTNALGRDVTRKEITEAAPTFTRADARRAASVEEVPLVSVGESPDPASTPAAPAPASPAGGGDADWDAGDVEVLDEVVGLDVQTVFNDLELVYRAIKEFNRQSLILGRRRDRANVKLKDVGRRSALLEKAKIHLEKAAGIKPGQVDIRAYLERQKEVRAERARKAQAFIEAGTTAEAVREQLAGPSKIDAALRQRQAGRGSKRPTRPVLVSK